MKSMTTRLQQCRRRLWFGACLLVLSGSGMAVRGQDSTPAPETINLRWALSQTLQHNATLKIYPYQLRISDGDILQARQRPLPTLGIELDNAAGSGSYAGTDRAELTLTLGQTLELGDKRDGRVALATAKQQRQRAEYEITRLDKLAETGRRYYQLLRAQLLQDWIERRSLSERAALAVIEKRANAGAASRADVSKVSLRLARSRALAAQLEGEAAFARAQLSALWAREPGFASASGDLLQLPALPDQNQLADAASRSPRLGRQRANQELAAAQVQLAKANTRNDLDLGVGIRHFEQSSDQALTLSLSMPFGSGNRGNLAAAQASRVLSDEQAQLAERELQVSLLGLRQSLGSLRQYARLAADSLLPQAQQLLADTEAGYAKGRYTVLQWADAQAERFELERELIETHTLIYLQLLELERLTGQSLVSPEALPTIQPALSLSTKGDKS